MPQGPEPPCFRIDVRPQAGRTVVALAGELDLSGTPGLDATLRAQLAAGPVLLDLAELTFIDSSGVRVLDGLLRDVVPNGWHLRLRRQMHGNVRQVFDMTALYEALPFDDDPEPEKTS